MKKILAATALMLACLNANAEGVYMGIGLGQVKTSPSGADAASLGLDTYSEHDSAISYKFFGGYNVNQYFAVEGGYQKAQEFFNTTGTLGSSEFAQHTEMQALFADVLGKVRVGDGFSVFAKLGLAGTEARAAFTCSGVYSPCLSVTATKFSPRAGIGAQYDITEKTALRFDLERTTSIGDNDTGKGNITYTGLSLIYNIK